MNLEIIISETRESEFCEPTILVKTVGTIRAFPPPPITMLIFHGLQNQDPFIDRCHVSTLGSLRNEDDDGYEDFI